MTAIAQTSDTGGALLALLHKIRVRLRTIDALHGTTIGFVVAAIVAALLALTPMRWTYVAAISGACIVVIATVNVFRRKRDLTNVADNIERRAPQLQNLLRTSAELIASPGTVAPMMRSMVFEQAESRTRVLDLPRLLPSRKPLVLALLSGALWVAMLWASTQSGARVLDNVVDTVSRTPRGTIIGSIDVSVIPPAYARLSSSSVTDPERVEALRGSRVRVDVKSNAVLELIHASDTIAMRDADGAQRAEFVVQDNGFIVVRTSSGDASGERRLIGLTAVEDRAPVARITAPGRDLFLLDSTAIIDVALDAADDLQLTGLRLRYTKVSGSGERFTFTEGEVPISIQKRTGKQWNARGQLRLQQLGLAQGDMVVYRAVATDARPGAVPAESDAFIVEIIGVGGDAAAGFSIDPEQDRYAVSQQMVILKTERLLARKSQMTAEALLDASRELSLEQRRVRAEFVFMMGGELAEEITAENSMGDLDETHEAESESDLSAGRMANRGRTALLAAIRAMSRAATALNVAELERGLVHEKTAVRELESAFSRTRYLLRAFTEREQLDLTRRLSGNLEDARSSQRNVAIADEDGSRQLREALAQVSAVTDSGDLTALAVAAEQVLAVDPSSRELQQISSQLSRASRATNGSTGRRMLLDSATLSLAALLRSPAGDIPLESARQPDTRRLQGALRDAMERNNLVGRPPDSRR